MYLLLQEKSVVLINDDCESLNLCIKVISIFNILTGKEIDNYEYLRKSTS